MADAERMVFFFSFFLFLFVALIWLVHVIRNSYSIIVPGLRKLYIIFIFHLIIMYLMLVLYLLRPGWKANMADLYSGNPHLCHLHGRVSALLFLLSILAPTLFNMYKIMFSSSHLPPLTSDKLTQDEDATQTKDQKIWSLGIWVIHIAFGNLCLVCGSALIFMTTTPYIEGDVTACSPEPSEWMTIMILSMVLWCIINGYTTYKSFRYHSLRDKVPGLEREIIVNMYVAPLISFTTMISRLLPPFLDAYAGEYSMTARTFTRTMPALLDNLLNSYVMYWFLFKNTEVRFMEDHYQDLTKSPSNASKSRSRSPDQEYWISFTGAHPVQMNYDFIVENNLQSLIIAQDLHKRQCILYRRHKRIFRRTHEHSDIESVSRGPTPEIVPNRRSPTPAYPSFGGYESYEHTLQDTVVE